MRNRNPDAAKPCTRVAATPTTIEPRSIAASEGRPGTTKGYTARDPEPPAEGPRRPRAPHVETARRSITWASDGAPPDNAVSATEAEATVAVTANATMGSDTG